MAVNSQSKVETDRRPNHFSARKGPDTRNPAGPANGTIEQRRLLLPGSHGRGELIDSGTVPKEHPASNAAKK